MKIVHHMPPSLQISDGQAVDDVQFGLIKRRLRQYLNQSSQETIDFRILGHMLLMQSKALSSLVDKELLLPISKWMTDKRWSQRLQNIGGSIYNWTLYKQKQRRRAKQQNYLAAGRLKLFRREFLKQQNSKKEASSLSKSAAAKREFNNTSMPSDFMCSIVSCFSPLAHHQRCVEQLFDRARSLKISDLLPWKVFIVSELNEDAPQKLDELQCYYPEDRRTEKVLKLMHLLELDKQGQVLLCQDKAFGDIWIQSRSMDVDTCITITDQKGTNFSFDWADLTPNQQAKIINDSKESRIICKQGERG